MQGGREGWSGWGIWSQQLFMSPDGNFALCMVSANNGRERQDLVSVVSLGQLEIVTSVRTSALAEVSGNIRTYSFDHRGYLIVDASTPFPRHPGDDTFFGGASHKLATSRRPSWRPAK